MYLCVDSCVSNVAFILMRERFLLEVQLLSGTCGCRQCDTHMEFRPGLLCFRILGMELATSDSAAGIAPLQIGTLCSMIAASLHKSDSRKLSRSFAQDHRRR